MRKGIEETLESRVAPLDAGAVGRDLPRKPQTGDAIAVELKNAERIARTAHAGQKEESTGDDYILHVERVVSLVDDADAKAVAWLHDVLEDSDWTAADLLASGIRASTIMSVVWLTRTPPYDYATYIDRLYHSHDATAVAVKVADLQDHLRPNCPARLRPRYERALELLGRPRA